SALPSLLTTISDHRIGDQSESAGLFGSRKHDLARAEVGSADAAATALPAVVASGASVMGCSNDGQPRRNTSHADFVTGRLDDGFSAARPRRRQENSVRCAGYIFRRAENPNVRLHLVVVGSDLFVLDRPIIPHAIGGTGFEIHRGKAQRDTSPVIGTASDNP